MTKSEIIAALEGFKDSVSDERRSRISELQTWIGTLLEPKVEEPKVEEKLTEPVVEAVVETKASEPKPRMDYKPKFIPKNKVEAKAITKKPKGKHKK